MIERQIDKYRQTDIMIETDRQIDIQIDKKTFRYTHRQTDIYDRETDR